MHKIAFVVPTKDRPDDLRRMLQSVASQSRRPDQLIVVDGGNPDIRHLLDEFADLNIEYVRVFPPSLAKQRNAGMQKLRDGISRALYHDPDVLVLDEATSSLDSITEKGITDTINEVSGGETVIIIAHQISTVKNCDHLFFFKDGMVRNTGNYNELSMKNREFHRIAPMRSDIS